MGVWGEEMSIKLDQILNNLAIIQSCFPEDACIILADTEKIIGYRAGQQIDLKLTIGAGVENFKGTVTYKALTTGKKFREERGAEMFGVAYISTATPIIDNGKVVGVLSTVASNQKLDTLRTAAVELTSITEELSLTSEELTKVSDYTAKYLQELSEESQMINEEIIFIEQFLAIIKSTAVKSQILGLNASIESARAGDHGKGFMIVANEIKKMADSSKTSVEKIEPQLKTMMTAIEKMTTTIEEISAQTEEQSAMVKEFNLAYKNIVETATRLSKQANI